MLQKKQNITKEECEIFNESLKSCDGRWKINLKQSVSKCISKWVNQKVHSTNLRGKKKNGSPCKRAAHQDYKYLVKASVCWILKWISCWSICLRTFSTSNRVFCTSLMHSTWVFFGCTWEEKRQKKWWISGKSLWNRTSWPGFFAAAEWMRVL